MTIARRISDRFPRRFRLVWTGLNVGCWVALAQWTDINLAIDGQQGMCVWFSPTSNEKGIKSKEHASQELKALTSRGGQPRHVVHSPWILKLRNPVDWTETIASSNVGSRHNKQTIKMKPNPAQELPFSPYVLRTCACTCVPDAMYTCQHVKHIQDHTV